MNSVGDKHLGLDSAHLTSDDWKTGISSELCWQSRQGSPKNVSAQHHLHQAGVQENRGSAKTSKRD